MGGSWCFLLLRFVLMVNSLKIDLDYQNKISNGKQLYGELVEKAQSYGDCWKNAMFDLHSGCKRLTEEIQSRLALSFANCFLEHTGSNPCHCAADMPISDCLKNSNERVFSTYTAFFTHTHSICHYLQHKEWQEEASKTVLALIENSELVSRKLDYSSKSQSKIIDLQQAALNEQKRLISSGRILKSELQHSRQNARDMYKEFKTVTDEQKFLLFQVFDRLGNLQNFVLGEFTGVYSIVYHAIVMLLIYISTSVPRTAGARIWLILVLIFSITVEKFLTTYTLQESTLEINPKGVDGVLSSRIWLCRKIVCAICLIILATVYYRYKDYNIINNKILQEIQQQNKELLGFMKGLSFQENVFQHQNFVASSNSFNHALMPLGTVKEKVPIMGNIVQGSVFQHQNSVAPLNSTTIQSPLLPEIEKEKITVTGIKETKSSIVKIKNTKLSRQVLVNKENIPLCSTPTADFTNNLKKTLQKELVYKKRNKKDTQNKVNSPGILSHEGSALSELESPVNRRYNLRSSSRLNSPQSPYGEN